MDETNKRLRQSREAKYPNLSRSEVARIYNWVPSTYASHENGQTSLRRLPDEVKIYAKAFDVDEAYLLNKQNVPKLTPTSSPLTPDGEKIKLEQLESDQAKVLEAAIAGRRAEVWRVTDGDVLAGAGYQVGDFLIVDLAATPKSRDFVLAEQQGVPTFRQYIGKFLYYLPLTAQPAPATVDDFRIIVRGVIISKLSI